MLNTVLTYIFLNHINFHKLVSSNHITALKVFSICEGPDVPLKRLLHIYSNRASVTYLLLSTVFFLCRHIAELYLIKRAEFQKVLNDCRDIGSPSLKLLAKECKTVLISAKQAEAVRAAKSQFRILCKF